MAAKKKGPKPAAASKKNPGKKKPPQPAAWLAALRKDSRFVRITGPDEPTAVILPGYRPSMRNNRKKKRKGNAEGGR
jgi:hypothetical protein